MLIQVGGCGLNLTEASIVIQCEIWWNRNTELQAIARAYRQGQEKTVKYFRVMGRNSAICQHMRQKQEAKMTVNNALMEPLTVKSGDDPAFVKLIFPLLPPSGVAG